METETKKMPLWAKILLIVLVSLAALAALVLLGARAYFRWTVSDYYDISEQTFKIPGLGDNFVPQGLDYDPRSNSFLVTGYMSDGSPSPIYFVNPNGNYKTILLSTADGKDFTGHAGGLTVHGDYVYVAGGADYCLYVFSYSELRNGADGSQVKSLGTFSTGSKEDGTRVSFVGNDGTFLYAGEFYGEKDYPTHESHKLTTHGGDYQQAFATAYAFSDAEDAVFGLSPVPAAAYSLPDQVQGMCFYEGKIYLSTSYGLSFSNLYVYDQQDIVKQKDITLTDTQIPLYALDSDCMETKMKCPPMSEELAILDGKLYTMCESASNKYIFGKFTSAKWCYATRLDQIG